jgi:hypothetical protein
MVEVVLPLGFTTRETGYWLGRPRPTIRDKKIQEKVKQRVAADILVWLGHDGTLERIVEDLDTILSGDGYTRARELERKGYTPDTEFVEILDEVDTYLYEEVKAAEKEWMRLNDNVLILEVGDIVSAETVKKTVTGSIAEVHVDTGYYLVFCEAEGHVKQGCGTHGVYVAFEKVAKLTE